MEVPQIVLQEIENIKKFATEEEKNKLDIAVFDSTDRDRCIYGLMADGCRSDRAMALIQLCVNHVTTIMFSDIIEVTNWNDNQTYIHFAMCHLLTPLEKAIYLDQELGIKIILYIQNLIDQL